MAAPSSNKFDRLFDPKTVAVVGSVKRNKIAHQLVTQLTAGRFPGTIAAVNPKGENPEGYPHIPGYPDITRLPSAADLALICVPAQFVEQVIGDCGAAGVPFAVVFTSGFSEVGKIDLEEAMIRVARKGGTRIVGPNCLGVHCADSGVSFDPTVEQEGPGTVAFLGQSGGVTNNFMRMANARGIGINKAVSFGNQMDLTIAEFLDYLGDDDGIRVIAAYIEDIKDGGAFLRALKRITPRKPVIILKGGVTGEGAEAAASHTGAMAGDHSIWSAVMRQHRCIEVHTERQMVDVVMLATSKKLPAGPRIGYLGAGGGTSVLFTDLAASAGFLIPELSEKIQKSIGDTIPDVNTSTRNPVDLGAAGFDYNITTHAMRELDRDENIDFMIIYLSSDFLNLFERKRLEEGLHAIGAEAEGLAKPVIPVLAKAADHKPRLEEIRLLALSLFKDAGLSMYNDLEDAVAAVRAVLPWSLSRK
jgi:acetyl-CoA synthetase (ADP-forming)/acetyltransferase